MELNGFMQTLRASASDRSVNCVRLLSSRPKHLRARILVQNKEYFVCAVL
eukprot:COSAG02_NODE_46225_length_350_cov_1.645418_1_plen_49_part_10